MFALSHKLRWIGVLALLVLGCNDEDGGNSTCVPGQTMACACDDGDTGAQECQDDGSGYGDCVCESLSSIETSEQASTESDGSTQQLGGSDEQGAPGCVPGATSSCFCTNGLPGAQVCNDSGKGMEACICEEVLADAGPTEDAVEEEPEADVQDAPEEDSVEDVMNVDDGESNGDASDSDEGEEDTNEGDSEQDSNTQSDSTDADTSVGDDAETQSDISEADGESESPFTEECMTSADCNDDDVCTLDICNAASGCEYFNQSGPCDDGLICTTNDSCGWYESGTFGSPPSWKCLGGESPDCDDDDPCTLDSCTEDEFCINEAIEGCEEEEEPVFTDECISSADCDDGNICTLDTCNVWVGCEHIPQSNPCDDGLSCTQDDTCFEGACSGEPLDCDDLNPCTLDTCSEEEGCGHEAIEDCVPSGAGCTGSGCSVESLKVVDIEGENKTNAGGICAVVEDGSVRCWGNQHAFGTVASWSKPTVVHTFPPAEKVIKEQTGTFIQTETGQTFYFGELGQAGVASNEIVWPPTNMSDFGEFAGITVGDSWDGAYWTQDGVLYTVGGKYSHGLGANYPEAVTNFTVNPTVDDIKQVVFSGYSYFPSFVALTYSGEVFAWGWNGLVAGPQPTYLPTMVPLSDVVQIWESYPEDGYSSICALAEGGAIYCWGDWSFKSYAKWLFLEDKVDESTPSFQPQFIIDLDFNQVGGLTECICGTDGTPIMRCFGRNGSLLNTLLNKTTDELSAIEEIEFPAEIVEISEVFRDNNGNPNLCALLIDGSVWCIGQGAGLGIGQSIDTAEPVQVLFPPLEDNTPEPTASCGADVECDDGIACTADFCIPTLGCTNLGVDDLCDDDDPCTIDSCSDSEGCVYEEISTCEVEEEEAAYPVGIVPLVGGFCSNLSDGTVHCWGQEYKGELGQNTVNTVLITPKQVPNVFNADVITSISQYGMAAYIPNEGWMIWGSASSNGSSGPTYEPTWLVNSENVIDISLSTSSPTPDLMFLHENGDLEKANSNEIWANIPNATVLTIDVGTIATCALTSDHEVWCWGKNQSGSLSPPSPGANVYNSGANIGYFTEQIETPHLRTDVTNVATFHHNDNQFCSVTNDGFVYCSGGNPKANYAFTSNGVFGVDGLTLPQFVYPAVKLSFLNNIKSMKFYSGLYCALTMDNELKCWGSSWDSYVSSSWLSFTVPQDDEGFYIPFSKPVADFAVKDSSTICALMVDKTIQCVGHSSYIGKFGNSYIYDPITIEFN